ncbi:MULTISPECIES: phosphate ABC transporter permease PstA [Brevibacillus]|jgi:phosphate transport system permease protein|uniref:Phosphate transport system permease protein PstA n=1 Tax=Brevibacillus borstelensis AK1 TaxID=1300222 RepID=M8D4Y6_9BACL|nr:phosphate ABC transporter permease PstA [Brevibacillus borstelensis]EMT51349.1 phosphate ABC transporter permease [Brevibacillus borstelensis AK1]KKX54884.1 phosphate ABC transporter permease [Brevibacillus borstelensis cifa_chp40]MBE5393612.1 phosphate ABC transporter permease PstA [Brevibacillus borstelensis]MCC0565792.1 phosphate ABC transporter permease PstA [Brevibacillus borstelensis]MCM3472828.1 phosphate ABC transporter permease PstA [Brevibacillus borstelensis]
MSAGNLTRRKIYDRASRVVFLLATLLGVAALGILLYRILSDGLGWLDWQFISSFASRFPEKAGILSALFGSLWIIGITAPVAFILGIGTALYLEEYAKKGWFTNLIQVNINNLAGVPSIVFGILGLGLFVEGFLFGRTILSGALTMALLVLPIIVVASQEAIRSVPQHLRNASYALGASKWQTIRGVVIPAAFPSILTGFILALSRAIGETAPLIVVGAVTFIAFVPSSPLDQFTVLPIQIYSWTSKPQDEFRAIAAAGIIVLLIVLFTLNATAVYLRNKYQKRY